MEYPQIEEGSVQEFDPFAGLDWSKVQGGEVMIYRQDKTSGARPAFLDTLAADGFDMTTLRDSYGPGDYALQFRKNGQYVKQVRVKVAEPSKASRRESEGEGLSQLAQLLAAMQANTTAQIEALGRMVIDKAATPANPVADRKAMLQEMMLFKEMFASPVQQQGQDLMGILKMGMELGGLANGNAAPAETDTLSKLAEMAQSFAPLIASVAGQRQATPAARPVARPATMQPNPAPRQAKPEPALNNKAATAPAIATEQEMFDLMERAALKAYSPMLLDAARQGADVTLYADLILQHAGDNTLGKFKDPAAVKALASISPEVAEHAAWFEALRLSVMEGLAEPPADEINQLPVPVAQGGETATGKGEGGEIVQAPDSKQQ